MLGGCRRLACQRMHKRGVRRQHCAAVPSGGHLAGGRLLRREAVAAVRVGLPFTQPDPQALPVCTGEVEATGSHVLRYSTEHVINCNLPGSAHPRTARRDSCPSRYSHPVRQLEYPPGQVHCERQPHVRHQRVHHQAWNRTPPVPRQQLDRAHPPQSIWLCRSRYPSRLCSSKGTEGRLPTRLRANEPLDFF